MIRSFILFTLLIGCFVVETHAQARVAYVDSDYILNQMPEFRSAQRQLEEAAEQYKLEIKAKADALAEVETRYDAEFPLLPTAEREERENKLNQLKADFEKLKQDKFGAGGELFRKRQQLIKPIQDKVFEAIQQLAKESAIDLIFDRAGAVTLLYANSRYDRSDEVLEKLGVVLPGSDK